MTSKIVPSKVESLLKFQPPLQELTHQQEIFRTANRFYEFYGFTDRGLIFSKQYLSENFGLLKSFEKISDSMIQGLRSFHTSWAHMQNDPSPLISTVFIQLENIIALSASVSPMEFKVEEQVRESFNKKIISAKVIQSNIDKKFQSLWQQCHLKTSNYYQKFEEHKEQVEKVRRKYETYEKETRDLKSYNITWVKKLESNLERKITKLNKKKEESDRASNEAMESYKALTSFFENNQSLIQDFLKLFVTILVEMTIFMIENARINFLNLRKVTTDILNRLGQLNLQANWNNEDHFIKETLADPQNLMTYIKEMNRINYQRHECLSSFGILSQETMMLCQEYIEKFIYFEEKNDFEAFFSQFDDKLFSTSLPFVNLMNDLRQSFIDFFALERMDNEQLIHRITSQRSMGYAAMMEELAGYLNEPNLASSPSRLSPIFKFNSNLDVQGRMDIVRNSVLEYAKCEESLAKDFIKDLERLFSTMNSGLWNKVIQVCQTGVDSLLDRIQEDQLLIEVKRIEASFTQNSESAEGTLSLCSLDSNKEGAQSQQISTSNTFEDLGLVGEEGRDVRSNTIDKYKKGDFKFFKEKKAEIMSNQIKRQNEHRLSIISNRSDDKTKESIKIEDGERVLESYSCAYVDKILLQGRIYITLSKILFKSRFNAKTLLGSTKISIPIDDIVSVTKRKNGIGMENMIQIVTKKGELLFTSFVYRDKAYNIMNHVIEISNPTSFKEKTSALSFVGTAEALDLDEEIDQMENEDQEQDSAANRKLRKAQRFETIYRKRNQALLNNMISMEKYENLGYQYNYDIDYNTFFQVLFSNEPLTYKGKEFTCFWEAYENELGTFNTLISSWDKPLPKNISRKKDIVQYNNSIKRTAKGAKNLKVSMPFLPKVINYTQTHKLYFVNESLLTMQMDVEVVEKLPMVDSFKLNNCFNVIDKSKENGKDSVTLEFKYFVVWNYEPMFKNKILKSTVDETLAPGPFLDKLIRDLIEQGYFERKKAQLANLESEESEDEQDVNLPEENETHNLVAEEEVAGFEVEKLNENILDTKILKATMDDTLYNFKITKRLLLFYFLLTIILSILTVFKYFINS